MNRYMIVCRLRWPAILILTGIIALLDRMDVLSWGHAWPLYLILFGVLSLLERAMLAQDGPPPAAYPYGYAGAPGYPPQAPAYPTAAPAAPATSSSTGIVPAHGDFQSTDPEHSPRKSWEEEGR
jgi:Domain of unknown function (DUF5668)